MNTIVNFELAKLLKEKGFDVPMIQNGRVYCEGTKQIESIVSSNQVANWNANCYVEICSAPTIVEVIMWLYEKHGIWVTVNPNHSFKYWSVNLVTDKNANDNLHDATIFDSPTEAYEAAIEYILNNLI